MNLPRGADVSFGLFDGFEQESTNTIEQIKVHKYYTNQNEKICEFLNISMYSYL